jgi:DUF1365 family protein
MQSAIFEGQVKHRRMAPVTHGFRYPLFMFLLDLDELDEVFRGRWLWSVRRWAVGRFRREDHFGDPAESLQTSVRRYVHESTGRRPEGPIRLLTHLSYFGYCFNPVSFYYCYKLDGKTLEAIVAEVNNTPWGERQLYVLAEDDASIAGKPSGKATYIQQEFATKKLMHVSPFMPMDVDYRWRFTMTDDQIIVFMETARHEDTVFAATMSLERREITGRSLARVLVRYPLMTVKVIAAIHWQALRLWIKGAPVHSHTPKATDDPGKQQAINTTRTLEN